MIHSDLQLKQHVEEELSWEPSVNPAAIGVAVRDAVVTLSGYVDSYAQKHTTAEIVASIRGVRAVANELEVKLPADTERSDEDIAHTVAMIFVWNSSIPKNRIQVQVSQGWVTLEGSVDWYYQRKAAELALKDLMGVKGIANLITITSVTPARAAKPQLEAAYKRSINEDLEAIQIDVDDASLILSGTVHSMAVRTAMEHIAWKTPGIELVDNRLEVDPSIAVIALT